MSEPITFGSLFAGIGGFDLGFERAGMVCKWQVEIDDYATRVLEKHWPDVTRWRDVRTWPQPDTERVDVICGGFPCQDISYAGKGAGLAGERSGLFFNAVRCIGELGPRVIVLENVAALLTRGLGDVLGTLASIGFDAEWHCIPAASFGADHARDRAFIVAYPHRIGRRELWSREASSAYFRERQNHDLWGKKRNRRHRNAKRLLQSAYRKAAAANTQRVPNGIPSRMDRDRLRGLGNAVVPQVAEWIGRQVVASLRGGA